MPYLNYKRGRYLLTVGVAETGLGLSYALEETSSRAAMFSWLPFSTQWVGAVIIALGVLSSVAAFRSRSSDAWDSTGWKAAMGTAWGLTLLWITAAGRALSDSNPTTNGWSPWATVLVYGSMALLVWEASDWPNPPHPGDGWLEDEAPEVLK